jgi:hypothetical protein
MDERARRNLGAHYTSEENILKLIKPLFLDALWEEFGKVHSNRNKLFEFHKKLRSLSFLDPACGCGNFLVVAYRELRLLELDLLRASRDLADAHSQRLFDTNLHQEVSIDVDQFHGIEIEEFPAQIAQVALWLIDHQMNVRVSEEFGLYFARIPLTSTPHIVNGNALRVDWDEVLPAEQASYVMGNPPFVGKQFQTAAQKDDQEAVMQGIQGAGVLDFVAAWYVKAAKYAGHSRASGNPQTAGQPRFAFVSTNSITQGEQVGVLWGWLLAQGMHIHFAHRTFRWSNEARGVAAVHCVIVGFGAFDTDRKAIYEYEGICSEPHAVAARNINAYLVDAPDVALPKRSKPICMVPAIVFGSMPNDGGHLLLSEAERAELIAREPGAAQWLRPFRGSDEFINNIPRWCLWLVDCPPQALRAMPFVTERVAQVKRHREASTRETTRRLATRPTLFGEIRQPDGAYLLVPSVSSERRQFVPVGFMDGVTVASNLVFVVPEATAYHFGVLSSTMHNAWVRYTCGRMKSDYRYSAAIVYNNFPWPESPSDKQRAAIEAAANGVLDARAQYPGASLADLYDPLTMPPALVKAHQALDRAVDAVYGRRDFKTDAERVAFLFTLYQRYTSLLPGERSRRPARRRPS